MALPRGAMDLSAVCDCGISCSYSLLFTVYSYGFLFNFTTAGQASASMTVLWVGLQFVIVVFPDHTYLRFDVKLAFVGWCQMCVLT